MSIKLDWDIESEQGKHKEHKEDFQQRRQRYLGFLRLLLIMGIFLAIIGAIVFVVFQRWTQVNMRLEQLLRDTVEAEVAALRIGDFASYANIQRSATDDWYLSQEQTFDEYQRLKSSSDVNLTGQILDIEINDQRARVQVQEIIGGVPFIRTWFYWRYEDGWRHVPPDYTFWGDSAIIERPRFAVRYRMVDAITASAIADSVDRWLDDTCAYIDCTVMPALTFDIVTERLPEAYWAPNEQAAWQMVLPSPYLGLARSDQPFDQRMQVDSATLLANRIIDINMSGMEVLYPTDAFFLRSAIVAWMVGRFVQVNPESYLIESLAAHYGTESVGQLLHSLQPYSDMAVLSPVVGVPSLGETQLDWRDFIEWRLNVEQELIQRADEANWQRLYDFSDSNVQQTAYARYNANAGAGVVRVLGTTTMTAGNGLHQLQAQVEIVSGQQVVQQVILFNMVNNVWLRAS